MSPSWVEGLDPEVWAGLVADAVRPLLAGARGMCDVRVAPPDLVAWARVRAVLDDDRRVRVWAPHTMRHAPADLVEVWVPSGGYDEACHEVGFNHQVVLRPPGMDDAAFAIYERLRLDGTPLPVAFEAAELLAA